MKTAKTLIKAIVILSVATLGGCVTMWAKPDKPVNAPSNRFSVKLPANWLHFTADRKAVTATKDGLNIQHIRFYFRKHDEAFKAIEKQSNANMLPSELAELAMATMRKGKLTKNAKVLENSPFTLAGHQAFKLIVEFRNEEGLRFRRMVYGFVVKDGVYFMQYQAPVLHFYNRDINDFRLAVSGFSKGAKSKKQE